MCLGDGDRIVSRFCRKSSKNYTESKYLSPFEFSDIYRDSEKFVDGSEKRYSLLESFDALTSKIGAWFLRVFTLSVSHCAVLAISTS